MAVAEGLDALEWVDWSASRWTHWSAVLESRILERHDTLRGLPVAGTMIETWLTGGSPASESWGFRTCVLAVAAALAAVDLWRRATRVGSRSGVRRREPLPTGWRCFEGRGSLPEPRAGHA